MVRLVSDTKKNGFAGDINVYRGGAGYLYTSPYFLTLYTPSVIAEKKFGGAFGYLIEIRYLGSHKIPRQTFFRREICHHFFSLSSPFGLEYAASIRDGGQYRGHGASQRI